MKLTVLIATHNGAKTLPQVFEAFLHLDIKNVNWKIVIVDNASTDATPEILRKYSERLPLLSLRTEKQGKNIALNIGLEHIEGDLIVLTDDDVIPSNDWLEAIHDAANLNPSFDIFAGRIDAIWPDKTPSWIFRLVNLGATYGITPSELKSGPIPAEKAWGANMAIRRKVFDAGYRFNELVGPTSGQYMMGSETEFTSRLKKDGYKAWFSDTAKVGHIIRENQIQREWIIQRGYRLGRHMFHQEAPEFGDNTPMWRGAPRWKYRRLLDARLMKLKAAITRNTDQAFKADWEISFLKGYLFEANQAR